MAKVTLHATIFGEDGIKTRDYETALIPDAKNQEMQVINLYPDKTYQKKIEGFGAALTESAGYALSRMSKRKSEESSRRLLWKRRHWLYNRPCSHGQLRFLRRQLLRS